MVSKEVLEREVAGRVVGQAARDYGSAIGAGILNLLAPVMLPGEQLTAANLANIVGRFIGHQSAAVGVAGIALEKELQDDAKPRAERDQFTSSLRTEIIDGRDLINTVHGPAGLDACGMKEPCPTSPEAIKAYAQLVLSNLNDPKLTLPAKKANSAGSVNVKVLATTLQPLYDGLSKALSDVDREKNEASAALIAKDRAIEAHDHTFTKLAGLIEALARAADMPEIAERIRPSGRQPGVLANPPPADGTPAAAPAKLDPSKAEGMPGSDPFIK